MVGISTLRRLRQEDHELKPNLGSIQTLSPNKLINLPSSSIDNLLLNNTMAVHTDTIFFLIMGRKDVRSQKINVEGKVARKLI